MSAQEEAAILLRFIENPETWVRVSKIVVGGAMVIGGLYMLTSAAILRLVGGAVASVVKGAT